MSPRSSPETERVAEIEPSKPFVRGKQGIVGRMRFAYTLVDTSFY